LKTLKLKTEVPSDIFRSVNGNTDTHIRTTIFDGLIKSIELIRIFPSLPVVHSLKVHDFKPDSISIIKPTFQLDHCKKLDFEFVSYSIETTPHNTLLLLLPCIPNIEKLIIETSKQFDLEIIVD
jgi:hypothetical protein